MARLSSRNIRKAYKKFLAAANQQSSTVYIAKVADASGGDQLLFGLGGTRTVTKVALDPSPFIEDVSQVRAERLGSEYLDGDKIINFIPPLQGDGSEYSEATLNTFNEIWIGPITNEGTVNERPASRFYVRRYPNTLVNGLVAVCTWVINPTQPRS